MVLLPLGEKGMTSGSINIGGEVTKDASPKQLEYTKYTQTFHEDV